MIKIETVYSIMIWNIHGANGYGSYKTPDFVINKILSENKDFIILTEFVRTLEWKSIYKKLSDFYWIYTYPIASRNNNEILIMIKRGLSRIERNNDMNNLVPIMLSENKMNPDFLEIPLSTNQNTLHIIGLRIRDDDHITNQGFDFADNITVDFLKDADSGETIDSATVTLSPNESTAITFEIDNSYLDITESLNARSFYISAQTSALESDYGNNSEIVNVYPDYKVTVTSDNGGTVNGSGTFPYESTTTITAVPDEGYKFFVWYENGNILYNTSETYEIKVNSNRNLKALFVVDPEYPATVTGSVYQLISLNKGNNILQVAFSSDIFNCIIAACAELVSSCCILNYLSLFKCINKP